MKKLLISIILLCLVSPVFARWGEGVLQKKGAYYIPFKVSVSSTAVATLSSASPKKCDTIFRNPSSTYDLIIASCTVVGTARQGFHLLPGETFSPQGSYQGDYLVIFDSGCATTNVSGLDFYQNEP